MIHPTYRFFLKFGKRTHIEALRNKGEIYMNTINYFTELPEENLIGDRFEGIRYLKHLKGINVKIPNNILTYKRNIYAYPKSRFKGHLFCLYGGDEKLLEKNLIVDYGELDLRSSFSNTEYMAIINKPNEFIRRLEIHFNSNGWEFEHRNVDYINFDEYEGPLDQFSKRKQYEGQNEYRIFVNRGSNDYLKFEIGDLSDICHIAKADQNLKLGYRVVEI